MKKSDIRVSLVIPGRNAERTIRQCLEAVVPLLYQNDLEEIIFVDDGSTDKTSEIIHKFPVRYLVGKGKGPGSARNLGWRAATHSIVWFIDADCVAESDTLHRLMPHLTDPKVAGVGGSYDNMLPDSLLACLIHEEIAERHRSMGPEVDFLGSFNVLYKRQILARVGGFDENCFNGPGSPGAEDAELAYRLHEEGYVLRFVPESRVKHYHPTILGQYFRSQMHHGYWRANLYIRHPNKIAGDSYSNITDNFQPPIAMLLVSLFPVLAIPSVFLIPISLACLLILMQVPMTCRLIQKTRQWKYLLFAPMSIARAVVRGIGMMIGLFGAWQTMRR